MLLLKRSLGHRKAGNSATGPSTFVKTLREALAPAEHIGMFSHREKNNFLQNKKLESLKPLTSKYLGNSVDPC